MQGQPVNTTWSCFCYWIAVEYQACPCALFPGEFACLCFWLSAPPAGVCVLVGHTFKLDAEGPSKDVGDLEIRGGILMATASSAALSSGVLLCSLLFFIVSFESHFWYRIKNFSSRGLIFATWLCQEALLCRMNKNWIQKALRCWQNQHFFTIRNTGCLLLCFLIPEMFFGPVVTSSPLTYACFFTV